MSGLSPWPPRVEPGNREPGERLRTDGVPGAHVREEGDEQDGGLLYDDGHGAAQQVEQVAWAHGLHLNLAKTDAGLGGRRRPALCPLNKKSPPPAWGTGLCEAGCWPLATDCWLGSLRAGLGAY